ncbi:hypothetical protein KAR91_75230 [Candidatus Pacearchaeota archaeon]|nr:hypothetical protein [Candidatus Pacearchaeota archaeon]
MGALCIRLISLNTEISAAHEFISLADLSVEIAAQNYHTEYTDLSSEIAACFYYIDLDTSIAAQFPDDIIGPYILPETYPLDNEGGISIYGPIYIVVEDLISGVDLSSLELTVNSVIYNSESSEVTFLPITIPYRYAIRFIPSTAWSLNSTITVTVFIKDRAGNPGIVDLTA